MDFGLDVLEVEMDDFEKLEDFLNKSDSTDCQSYQL